MSEAFRGPSIHEEGPKFRRRVLFLGAFLCCLTIVNVTMGSMYSNIGGACLSTATCKAGEPCKMCEYDIGSDWQACMGMTNNPVTQQAGKMVSNFATSMAFMGQATLVYTWLGFVVLFRSLCHYEWLPSTIAFLLYAVVGVVAYYAFNPFLPLPHQTPPTVASMSVYIREDMYDQLDNTGCDTAYHFNLWFLIVQYTSVGVVVLLLIIAFKATLIWMR